MRPTATPSPSTPQRSREPLPYPAGDATVIAAHGHVTAAGFLALERQAIEALDAGCKRVVLDLHEVVDIEPDALGVLWAALRGIRRRGGTLGVVGVRHSLLPALRALDSGGLLVYSNVRTAVTVGGER